MSTVGYKIKFTAIGELLKHELDKLRTARATPALVEDIFIETYGGSRLHLKELASISVPEPRSLLIKPWDKSIIKDIEKSLVTSALEFNPILEADQLRIKLPELTQETRGKLVKKLHMILEENRIKARGLRDDVKKEIERQQKNGDISEDDKFRQIDELNKNTKDCTDQIDHLGKTKEEEIMTI
ncbi:MAG: ribosome recycling factor [Candidatus Jacksonbacteria bacterium RIFOXYC2_FULL_44_29]|nr:MAG: Ribosome-recycling factor [Parcubacteria group bacterium GW2011_GWC2_44_22]OGY75727.1 MAG: ribosome recycling factor [Candidatus Jacksonbacteria bacterium RIFOXYA2_FULL_43_12]OGY76293.1 MAG: ribosome recycling factor [Candidatus Jacksonbacteria bacterium RIFOXYB2_FULL_44_15]OGY78119.1 MAG: ribosome recycling factor [Candidatus Jacksonbacteria bacterium RIFOXYC2_FULL_44_29]OGY80972.1 MAG: ribosome recycling factor [Candidatus Jacksonbacteria bacterium RIFOXYD2_FULL_43_21]HBH46750.1 ribo